MGRRSLKGRYGRDIPAAAHNIRDDELLSGVKYADHRGLSKQRVAHAFKNGLIDRFEDSHGRMGYHITTCDKQWEEEGDPARITTPTRAQRDRGVTTADVVDIAGDEWEARYNPDDGIMDDGDGDDGIEDNDRIVYSKARAKAMLMKAGRDELKLEEEKKVLVNKAALFSKIAEAAINTRDQIMGIEDHLVDTITAAARSAETNEEARHSVSMELHKALLKCLANISESEIKKLFK